MSLYNITAAKPEDFEEIVEFFNENFIPYEPINAAINLCQKGYR